MPRLQTILKKALVEAGALKPIQMGPAPAKISVTHEVKVRLIERLLVESKFNNRFLVALTSLHFVVFILALWLVYYYRDSLRSISLILGGSALSLLAVTRRLSDLWRTKMGVDVLIAILPSLSPDQAIQAVKDLYYDQRGRNEDEKTDLKSED